MRFLRQGRPAVLAMLLCAPSSALAQAWPTPQGELVCAVTYQFYDANKHILNDAVLGDTPTPLERFVGVDFQTKVVDDHYPTGRTSRQLFLVDCDLGITDRLTLTGSLAGGAGKYVGPLPEGPVDDSNWNSSMQDAKVGVRYNVAGNGLWMLTPFVTIQFPIVDYPVVGHSIQGLGLVEVAVGAHVGRILTIGGQPKAFVQGRYGYSFIENPGDVPIDRSDGSLALGYFVGRATLQLGTEWRQTHGGLNPATDFVSFGVSGIDLGPIPRFSTYHDRAQATRDWRLGGGLSFAITDTSSIVLGYNDLLWGENTENAQVFTIGMDWNVRLWGGVGSH